MKLQTPRLLLRPWRDEDRPAYAAMNRDPRVMEFFPALMTREESDASFDRMQSMWTDDGFGPFAIEIDSAFAGFSGIWRTRWDVPFKPCVELGYRLLPQHWGKGIATEAAHAALAHGFNTLHLDEIVAYAVPHNVRSRRVLEKLGMIYSGDFDFTYLPEGHPLRPHVLYRLSADVWRAKYQVLPQASSTPPMRSP